jgi:hypothetical protein
VRTKRPGNPLDLSSIAIRSLAIKRWEREEEPVQGSVRDLQSTHKSCGRVAVVARARSNVSFKLALAYFPALRLLAAQSALN